MRWRLDPEVALHWWSWGEDSVVYDARSGYTHKFAPLAAAAAACLEQRVCSLQDLKRELELDEGSDGNAVEDDVDAVLQAVIDQFVALHWLQPVTSP